MNAPLLDTAKFAAAARAFVAGFAGLAMPEKEPVEKKSKQRSRRLTAEQKKSNRKKREYTARRSARQNNGASDALPL
jgi:hypothetical protein